MREKLELLQRMRSESGPMIVNHVCRCLLPFLVVGIVACGNDKPPPAGPDLSLPALIVLTPDSLRLLVNQTARVRVVVLNVHGDTLTNVPVSFASEDTTVAAVDSTGLVSARAGGAVYVTVASGGIQVPLLVRVHVNGTLVVSPHLGLVTADAPLQLAVEVRDSNGVVVPNAPVQYRSADTSIARVSETGLVTFNRSAGNATIIASSEGRIDGALVTGVLARVPSSSADVTGNGAGDVLIGSTAGGQLSLAHLRPPDTQPIGPTVVVHSAAVLHAVALDANASRAYVADGYFGNLIGLDMVAGSELFVMRVGFPQNQPWGPSAVAMDPGDSVVYYAANGNVNRLNVATQDTSPLFYHGNVYHIRIRDPWMYVAGSGNVQQYNIRTRSPGRELANSRFTADIALSSDGGRLYALAPDDTPRVVVWDIATGDTLPAIALPAAFASADYLAVQPSTGLLWIIAGLSGRVFVVDPVTRTLVRVFQPGGQPGRIVFTPSGLGVLGNGGGWVDFVR